MHIINQSCTMLLLGCVLSQYSWAAEHTDHYSNIQNQSIIMTNELQNNLSNHTHGNELYQSLQLETKWRIDNHQNGQALSELKYWLGTDENKLFVKAHGNKAESQSMNYDISLLYSRYIAEFWDIQVGLQHQQNRTSDDSNQLLVLGLHGLMPYFFETDAFLQIGKDDQLILNIETSRDLLLTQKLIVQPYLDAVFVVNDQSQYAKKSGLNEWDLGLQTRYEVTKQIMPFIDVSYAYDKGLKDQQSLDNQYQWRYALGLQFKY